MNKFPELHIDGTISEEGDLLWCLKYIIEHTERRLTKQMIRDALEQALSEVG